MTQAHRGRTKRDLFVRACRDELNDVTCRVTYHVIVSLMQIPVPPGTVVKDKDNGGIILGELKEGGERLLVAKGGVGGRGNAATKVRKPALGLIVVENGIEFSTDICSHIAFEFCHRFVLRLISLAMETSTIC